MVRAQLAAGGRMMEALAEKHMQCRKKRGVMNVAEVLAGNGIGTLD